LWGLTNPRIPFGIGFVDDFGDDSGSFSLIVSKSLGVGALTNPRVTFGSCFIDDFLVGTDLVFVDVF
jgi:hypothetical protein